MADITEIQKRIASVIKQEAEAPTAGSDEWNQWLSYINMAQHEWQESYQWPTLYKELNTLTSTSTGNVTLSLPSDFRKIDGFLTICDETNSAHEYPQVDAVARTQKGVTDKYFYTLGYPGNYSMVINPGTHGSGASIQYSYWASAGTLASPADVSMCPDASFLTQRTIAGIWEAMDDNRFPQAKAEADRILSRMLEFEQVRGHSYDDRIKTKEEVYHGFRIGRN